MRSASVRLLPSVDPTTLVTPAQFAEALGWSRSSFHRAVLDGSVPAPTETTPGGHRRWRRKVAVRALAKWGKAPPKDWTQAAA